MFTYTNLNEKVRYKKAWPGNLSACEYIQKMKSTKVQILEGHAIVYTK